MRVAFFTTRMTLGYGVDLTVHEIATRLVQQHGWQADVWTPTSDSTYLEGPYEVREIIVYGAPVNRALPMLELNAWRALRALRSRLAAAGIKYDVIVPCTHPYYGAGRALGVPQVFFNFGNVPTTGFTHKGKLNRLWLNFSERVIHKPASSTVVSISRFLHEQQSSITQRRGCVVHLGGDHYYPAPEGARERLRAQLGVPANTVLLGYCGRLHRDHPPYKGTHELLAVGRRVSEMEPRAQLVLCGVGSPADEAWILSEGALPLANLPPAQMSCFYAALDLYVCASHWEGFNLPIVEAAWHGVPAIAYDVGAHGEHVTAVLLPDGDREQLSATAVMLVRDEQLRGRLGQEAQQRAQTFTWDRAAAQFANVLRELTG